MKAWCPYVRGSGASGAEVAALRGALNTLDLAERGLLQGSAAYKKQVKDNAASVVRAWLARPWQGDGISVERDAPRARWLLGKLGYSAEVPAVAAAGGDVERLNGENTRIARWFAENAPAIVIYGGVGPQGEPITGMASAFEIKGNLPDAQVRAAVAEYVALMATEGGVSLAKEFGSRGVKVPASVLGSAGINFKKLGQKISGAAEQAVVVAKKVQTAAGVALAQVGGVVLKLEDKVPWLGQFFTRPLGFHVQAVALVEVGRVIREGRISSFDEKAFSRAAAGTFTAAGQALLVAGPMLPQPWGVAAMAVGALSLAVGKTINAVIDQAEAKRAGDAGEVTYYVDEAGNPVDENGYALDPAMRDIQARDAGAAQAGLRNGGDGYFYGDVADLNGQPVHAALVWSQGGFHVRYVVREGQWVAV